MLLFDAAKKNPSLRGYDTMLAMLENDKKAEDEKEVNSVFPGPELT